MDGTEKRYSTHTHSPFTGRREQGNENILPKPKGTRHQAKNVFERGFFVLHDLASANGTYVNGKRVRVAPLTHGAKLRLGNSYGRFSEELPTETDTPGADAGNENAITQAPIESLPTAAHERVSVH